MIISLSVLFHRQVQIYNTIFGGISRIFDPLIKYVSHLENEQMSVAYVQQRSSVDLTVPSKNVL